MNDIERITTPAAPTPAGHYSQAAAWRDLVFVSGQLPVRLAGTHTPPETFEAQARCALANLLAILSEAGSDPSDVLKVTAYVGGVENWPTFNRVFADAFGTGKPARAVVPVPELHHGYLVEVDAIAKRGADACQGTLPLSA